MMTVQSGMLHREVTACCSFLTSFSGKKLFRIVQVVIAYLSLKISHMNVLLVLQVCHS